MIFFSERIWHQKTADRLLWCRVLNFRESRDHDSVTHEDTDRKVSEVSSHWPCLGKDSTG